jgi:hypothetical protein
MSVLFGYSLRKENGDHVIAGAVFTTKGFSGKDGTNY